MIKLFRSTWKAAVPEDLQLPQ